MPLIKTSGITAASLIAAGGLYVGADAHLDNKYQPKGQYATSSEVQKLSKRILTGQFWDRMDDLQEARKNGNTAREEDILQELTEILADICEIQPSFRYCATGIPE